jgi:hypothetical protein
MPCKDKLALEALGLAESRDRKMAADDQGANVKVD